MYKPKVLIIGQSFNNNTGGGITLSNLFTGWPKNKLAVICSGYELGQNTNLKVCNNYYQLGWKEHKWIFPFNIIKRKYKSGKVILKEQTDFQKIEMPKSKWRLNLINHLFIPMVEFTGLRHFGSRLELSPALKTWLNDFSPDIIYMQASSLPDLKFCLQIQTYLNKPTTFHMMDDWPTIIPGSALFGSFWYRQIDANLRKVFANSTQLLSICDEMSTAYFKKYGYTFIPFHNPIDLDFWSKTQHRSYKLSARPEILYAGRTGLGIDTSLRMIAKAISYFNNQFNTSIQLILQTSERPNWIKNYSCVEYRPQVPYDQLPILFAKADFLLLPYDFSKKAIKYIQYSMPTKASEFMASGTPIIAFGPAPTAVIKYAKKYNWAKVITEYSLEAIALGIRQLVVCQSERESISANAKWMAKRNHDISKVSPSFKNVLMGTFTGEVESKMFVDKHVQKALSI
ncbi:MAG: group 1 glycosyl transferase [Saprospiraceae bacterium]|nr:group 1 glycosyl transferase [Saprospiraceae bacterium]